VVIVESKGGVWGPQGYTVQRDESKRHRIKIPSKWNERRAGQEEKKVEVEVVSRGRSGGLGEKKVGRGETYGSGRGEKILFEGKNGRNIGNEL